MTPMVNGKEVTVGPPLWLLAEVTYACPLHCGFCYNPVDYTTHGPELTTQERIKVLRDARAAGSVQCGFSGGEPLVRDDLEELVAEAHKLGFYTNLLTSGIGFTAERAKALKAAGLDHVQLSFQDSTRELNDFLSHTKTFALKQKAAQLIQENGVPMVLNCGIHRLNIDYIGKIIELAAAQWAPGRCVPPGRLLLCHRHPYVCPARPAAPACHSGIRCHHPGRASPNRIYRTDATQHLITRAFRHLPA